MRRSHLLPCLAVALTGCAAPQFSVQPALGQLEIGGSVGATSGANQVSGTTSLDALNLDDAETSFMPRVDATFGAHLSVSHMTSDYQGENGALSANFEFEGQQINAGANDIATDFDITATNATITWDVIPGDIELGLGVGVTLLDLGLRVFQPSTNTLVEPDSLESIPIPMPAVRFGMELGQFVLGAQLGGLSIDSDTVGGDSNEDFDVSYFDFDVNASYRILDGEALRGMATLGFRQFAVDASGTDGVDAVEFDFDYGGPYLGVTLVL